MTPGRGDVAARLLEGARAVDLVAALDDERYAVLLPNVEPREATALAERIRLAAAGRPFDGTGGPAAGTVSVGAAAWTRLDSARSLVARAESALARAASLGGNHVRGEDGVGLSASEPESLDCLVELAEVVDLRHGPTPGHAAAVGRLAERLALDLGLAGRRLEVARVAGLLHDLGKLAVPDWILGKPGALLPGEWREIERHPLAGRDLVLRVRSLWDVAPIIAAHHERWDGTGYPHGLRAEAIPVEARIVAVADAFVGMTRDRPYRETRSETSALTSIWRDAGRTFDPAVVSALLALGREGEIHAPVAETADAALLVSARG